MNRFAIVLVAATLLAGFAHAADAPTEKLPEQKAKPDCYASIKDWLNTSAKDCPLTYAGFTPYGVRLIRPF
jgi:hypothetical protein